MLTPSPTPTLLLELRQLLETDYAVPALWDPDKQVLLDNDAYFDAQIEAIKLGTNLAAGSITDVLIGSRTIADPTADLTNTLTNHLTAIITRIRNLTGVTSWHDPLPTTLANLQTHATSTGAAHGATASQTVNRIIMRDANGYAHIAVGPDAGHIANRGYVDAVASTVASHDHDERYYTKTQLGASGAYGTNPVHADRVSAGTLQAARIPNLDASKVTAGTFPIVRVPIYSGSVNGDGSVNSISGGWSAVRTGAGLYTLVGPLDVTNLVSLPHVLVTPFANATRVFTVQGHTWSVIKREVYIKAWNTITGANQDTGFTFAAIARS